MESESYILTLNVGVQNFNQELSAKQRNILRTDKRCIKLTCMKNGKEIVLKNKLYPSSSTGALDVARYQKPSSMNYLKQFRIDYVHDSVPKAGDKKDAPKKEKSSTGGTEDCDREDDDDDNDNDDNEDEEEDDDDDDDESESDDTDTDTDDDDSDSDTDKKADYTEEEEKKDKEKPELAKKPKEIVLLSDDDVSIYGEQEFKNEKKAPAFRHMGWNFLLNFDKAETDGVLQLRLCEKHLGQKTTFNDVQVMVEGMISDVLHATRIHLEKRNRELKKIISTLRAKCSTFHQ